MKDSVMTADDLLKPLSDDMPCGPDLDVAADPAYEEYYFGALGRLPAAYTKPGTRRPDSTMSPDFVFNTGDVDITAERAAIAPLLARSRDLRLLVLLAQWEALAGQIEPLADTITTIAALLETFGDHVHPTVDGGIAARRDTLADLANQATMIQPLLFLGLTGTDEVSLRMIKVAVGQLLPLQNEQDLKEGALLHALANPTNKSALGRNHQALLRLASAVERISAACQAIEPASFKPALDPLATTLAEMVNAIGNAQPDLLAPENTSPRTETASPEIQPVEAIPAAPAAGTNTVSSHTEARMLLEACEHYYRRAEPSSAALLLITQARLLIGRPLVEALETLLPAKAAQTLIDFGPQTGFVLNMDRLRQLTDNAPTSPAPEIPAEATPETPPAVQTSAEAAGVLHTVEHYFIGAEKSSPVPILLKRARSYLQRDFQSLVDELVPDLETNPQ